MAPEYGATMGYFPVDAESVNYLKATGRTEAQLEAFETYFKAQKLFGIPTKEDGIVYSTDLELNLGDVSPSVAGPKRPQDRIRLPDLKEKFLTALDKPVKENGFDKKDARNAHAVVTLNGKTPKTDVDLKHGSVLIAAITSCTNTSNPSVMIAAGLVAKKAVERGLTVNPAVKTSLAPGSRVVADYFDKTGLTPYLDKLGFQIVGYGCTTCIGNSGPLNPVIDEAITKSDLVAASVLSGNRNFEARVHPSIKANFLMSPPLVVAFALCRPRRHRPRQGAARHRQGRQAGLSQGNLAHERGSAGAGQVFHHARGLQEELHQLRRAESGVEQHPRHHRRDLFVGREKHLHPGAALSSRIFPWSRATSRRS